jgi:uroporphyrinogen-III synthase
MATQSAPVLITRPQAEAEALAKALAARFGARVRPVVTPLISPRFLTPVIPDQPYAAVIFTSAQAVPAANRLSIKLPKLAWCVGRKTAAVARAAGFDAQSADGDVEALAKALLDNPPHGGVLYLRGVDTNGNLLEKLRSFGLNADEAVVYTQEPQALSDEASALLSSEVDLIVPLFSPRTATLFRAAVPPIIVARLHLAAMSAAVAAGVADLPLCAKVIARRPDLDNMLDAVETLLADLPAP